MVHTETNTNIICFNSDGEMMMCSLLERKKLIVHKNDDPILYDDENFYVLFLLLNFSEDHSRIAYTIVML